MNPVQIKICGVTNVKDATAAAELGAHMIGLNFYAQSPRCIAPAAARQIVDALPRGTCPVGIFVDASVEEVRTIAKLAGIRRVQLHGETTPEMCTELAREVHVIRAFSTDARFRPQTAAAFGDCDVLIDAHDPNLRGGTGQKCDWSVAREILPFTRFLILSGGLNAQNVGRAITAVAPHAVDICSGIESAPGVKDHGALKKFITEVRATECAASTASRF